MEAVAARDSGAVVVAKRSGVVESVDAGRIVIQVDEAEGPGSLGVTTDHAPGVVERRLEAPALPVGVELEAVGDAGLGA